MCEYLFVYGTLLPGLAPDGITPAVEQLRSVGEGTVSGLLYDLGDFPGAVLDSSSERKIAGHVFKLPENVEVLNQLDQYEEFDPGAPDQSLFIRESHTVTLTTGETISCWIYIYNGKADPARILKDGRYPGNS